MMGVVANKYGRREALRLGTTEAETQEERCRHIGQENVNSVCTYQKNKMALTTQSLFHER